MSTATIGGINVTISATIDKFVKPVNQARALSKTFVKDLSGMTKAVLGFGTAVSAVGVVAGLKKTLDTIDDIGKSAARLGVSAQTVRVLQMTADETGVSFGAMASAVQKAGIAIRSALGGDKAKSSAFAQLGLDLKAIQNLQPEEMLNSIARAFTKVRSSSDRSALAQAIFGKSGLQLTGLLAQGGAEIQASIDRLKEFGGVLDASMVKKAQEANDAIENLGLSVKRLLTEVTVAAAPVIKKLADTFNLLASAIDKAGGALAASGLGALIGKMLGGSMSLGIGGAAAAGAVGSKIIPLSSGTSLIIPGTSLAAGGVSATGAAASGVAASAATGGLTVPLIAAGVAAGLTAYGAAKLGGWIGQKTSRGMTTWEEYVLNSPEYEAQLRAKAVASAKKTEELLGYNPFRMENLPGIPAEDYAEYMEKKWRSSGAAGMTVIGGLDPKSNTFGFGGASGTRVGPISASRAIAEIGALQNPMAAGILRGMASKGILESIAGIIKESSIGRTVGDLGGGLLGKAQQGLQSAKWAALYGPTLANIWAANNRPVAQAVSPSSVPYRGISAQDPLSREGFAQRVRSMGQGSAGNIAQKQLNAQERTATAVEKMAKNPPVTLKPANI